MSEVTDGSADIARDLSSLADFAPKTLHDAFSQKTLRRTMMEAQQKRLPSIASIHWEYEGERLLALSSLLKKDPLTGSIGAVFQQPVMDRESWEYTTPAGAIACDARGAGKIMTFQFDPHSTTPWNTEDKGSVELCVVRFSIRDAFVPESIRQEQQRIHGTPPPQPPFDLFSPVDLAKFVRTHGVVPLRIRILAYTSKTRYAYDVDLVHNTLLKDLRAGKLPISERMLRSTRLYHGMDRFVARRELPPVPNTILEMLFETKGLDPTDVSVLLHISKELATASMDTLTAREKAVWNKANRIYLPLPQAFLTEIEARKEHLDEKRLQEPGEREPVAEAVQAPLPASEPQASPPEETPGPGLAPFPLPDSKPVVEFLASDLSDVRASVGKLLDLIDEHPTCPLCSREMDVNSRELICETCLREVGG